MTKNQLFQSLITQAITNKVMFDYVLTDNWFGSKANMVHIHKDFQKLKIKTQLNHFAIKHKLIVRANQIAWQALKNRAA